MNQEELTELLNQFEKDSLLDEYEFVVHYTGGCTIRQTPDGYYAVVNATNHPTAPPGPVITSRLKWVNFDLGILETQNSIYIPVEENDAKSDN
jgi:hypothetical protein